MGPYLGLNAIPVVQGSVGLVHYIGPSANSGL